jgi:hypothetical protein
MEFDPKKGLEFGAYRMQQAQTDAKRMFNRVTDDANATADTFINAYVESNQAKLRVDRAYYQMIKDLETMGLSTSEIRKILKQNNIGGADMLMRGLFDPFTISDRNYQEVRNAGTMDVFPRTEIMDIQRNLRRQPLESVPAIEAPEEVEAPSGNMFENRRNTVPAGGAGGGSSSSQGAALPPPAFDSVPAPSAPQLPTAPANRASLSPSLLGGDLASQMANMEIAQRISGQ